MNSDILKAAKAIIAKPENWCKGARARNIEGQEADLMGPTAVQFCSRGALYRAVGSLDVDITNYERFLDAAARVNYVGFNELKSHAEVMNIWDVAIAKAEIEDLVEKLYTQPQNSRVLCS